ncbi:hypothetical protein OIO90_002060 [Microbotryomycetes sp. JL221]|nr:hypothetical protein OIO90_002060 [Microbotryomycetes sp. JL221]
MNVKTVDEPLHDNWVGSDAMDASDHAFQLNEMDEQGVAQLFAHLGYPFYEEQLAEHGITGDILVHLDHEALKDVGIHSVGQRLAILRAVYQLKVQQDIPVESGHYVPPYERIKQLEIEVHRLHETMTNIREDVMRPQSKPPRNLRSPTATLFPHPLSNQSTLSRANSVSAKGLPDSPRSPMDSPHMSTDQHLDGTTLTSTATAPQEINAPLTSGGALTPTTPTAPSIVEMTPQVSPSHGTSHAHREASNASQSTLGTSQSTLSASTSNLSSSTPSSSRPSSSDPPRTDKSSTVDNPYKNFRVTLEDPCYKVLPAALKKYKITDDWRQYALFICYGSTERCLAYDEKPLLLFQRLKESGNNPVFMLRHIKDIKSPIVLATAKHAARRDKRGANVGVGLDKAPTNRDGQVAVMPSRPTRLHHPPVLLPVGKDSQEKKEGGSGATMSEEFDKPPASPREAFGFAVSIYPYLAEREDEFDVAVGDTFVIISKTKGWWVVHRDFGPASANDTTPRKSAWVPAGCLVETTVSALSLATSDQLTNLSPGNASNVPIEPTYVLSVSTPNIALMDFERNGSDELSVKRGTPLRVLKRYNNWSYAIKDDGTRGWLPSWFCGKVPKKEGDAATPTTPTVPEGSRSAPNTGTNASTSNLSAGVLSAPNSAGGMISNSRSASGGSNSSFSNGGPPTLPPIRGLD